MAFDLWGIYMIGNSVNKKRMEVYLSIFYSSNSPLKVINLLELRKWFSAFGACVLTKAFIGDTRSGELFSWLSGVPLNPVPVLMKFLF